MTGPTNDGGGIKSVTPTTTPAQPATSTTNSPSPAGPGAPGAPAPAPVELKEGWVEVTLRRKHGGPKKAGQIKPDNVELAVGEKKKAVFVLGEATQLPKEEADFAKQALGDHPNWTFEPKGGDS